MRVPSAPITGSVDPPPFYLAEEIRLGPVRGTVGFVLMGGLILLLLWFFVPIPETDSPSLTELILIAFCCACGYLSARRLCYWLAWMRAVSRHGISRGIHPAARGELPKGSFICALAAPILLCGLISPLVVHWLNWGSGPRLWLMAAVLVPLVQRDVRAAAKLVFATPQSWIKERSYGYDVLLWIAEK